MKILIIFLTTIHKHNTGASSAIQSKWFNITISMNLTIPKLIVYDGRVDDGWGGYHWDWLFWKFLVSYCDFLGEIYGSYVCLVLGRLVIVPVLGGDDFVIGVSCGLWARCACICVVYFSSSLCVLEIYADCYEILSIWVPGFTNKVILIKV